VSSAAKSDPSRRRQPAARLPLRGVASARDFAFRQPSGDPASSALTRDRDEHGRSSFAEALDRRLALLAKRDAFCRFVQGTLARPFLTRHAWRPLGFVRLSDFTRERLGICGRTLEEDARIARALEGLPQMSTAFLDGILSWAQLRLLTRVARACDEKEWIRKAAALGLREIASLVDSRSPRDSGSGDEEPTVAWSVRVSREGRRLWRAAVELAQRSAGQPLRAAAALELVAAEAAGSQAAHTPQSAGNSVADAAVLFRLRALLASSAASAASSSYDSASASVFPSASEPADAGRSSPLRPLYDGSPEDIAIRDPELAAFLAECAREDISARSEAPHDAKPTADVGTETRIGLETFRSIVAEATGFQWFARPDGSDAFEPLPFDALEYCDPRELDARLREVQTAIQRLAGEIAGLLREAADWRIYRELGFENFEDYARARLDVCPATAWSLVALERRTTRSCPLLGAAWKEGRVTTLAARAILPVVGPCHANEWIARARGVTLRRLEAEVQWTLERRDAGLCGDDMPPPEQDADLTDTLLNALTTERLQMRSQEVKETTPAGAVQIRVFLPVSIAVLIEETLVALRRGPEPRGRVFERMLALAMLEWLAVPRHPDPVFARDGWCCAVPACSSRCNLHDHHIVFRSLGGGGAQGNRVTVCAAHHLHGIHAGRIRATGTAPHGIVWEMPFGRLLGDRYLRTGG
jgi:hypothetical protein